MKKLIAIALLLAAPYSWAATIYYVGAQGSTGNSCSDSNAGTSKVNPWCHAPGMPAATGTASSTTPGAGDSVILRGGDTWHYVVNSPDANDIYVGSGSWNIGYGGTATTCNFDVTSGAVIRTSCTYIGTDQTFYNATVCGASFCRPILTMDNATTTAYVGSCTHNNAGLNGLNINHSFVQLDDFEFTGMCTQGSAASQTGTGATMVEFSNNYYHGWSSTGAQGNAVEGGCGGGGCTGFVLIDHNVLDGSDSSGASTAYSGNQTGFQVCTDWEYNVLRYVGNNCVENSGQSSPHQIHIFHDNLFEYDYNVGHGNIIEMCSGTGSCNSFGDVYFWGNMTRHVAEGVTYDLVPASGGNVYAFGDIYFDIGNGANCLGPSGNGAGSTITAYVVNSTFDFQTNSQGGSTGGCKVAGGSPITVTFENNHFINYQTSGSAPGGMVTTPNCVGNNTTCSGYLASIYGGTLTDSGGEVWQSETTANAQGPTGCQGTPTCGTGNNYQPTSTSGTIYHAGNNLTSFCNSLPVAIAATACGLGSSGGVTEVSGQGGFVVGPTLVATPPSRGTTWDAGAYQFAAPTQATAPSCSPGSGTYTANQTVTCTNPNSGTTVICYSTSTTPATNGSGTGCTTGTQYTTALTVSANETLNVIAGTSTLTDSAVVTYSYVLQGGAPVCSPVGGTYIGTQSVALSQPQSLAIGYTTNGTSPVSNGSGGCSGSCTLYSGAISVASSETIKSIGMASGWTDSSIASCAYVINAPAATDMTMKGVTTSQGVTIVQ